MRIKLMIAALAVALGAVAPAVAAPDDASARKAGGSQMEYLPITPAK